MRAHIVITIFLFFLFFECRYPEVGKQEFMLLYDSPAQLWEATLPLGNGRIGMMPDGGVNTEKIVLNDITMWSGSEDKDALNMDAIKYLPEIQELLLNGKNLEAQDLSLSTDVREEIFNAGSKLSYADIAAFQEKYIKNKPVFISHLITAALNLI